MNDIAGALLERAKEAYARAGANYRDALLETGRLLHEFVLAYLRQGDGMHSPRRQADGFTRRNAVAIAAKELGETPKRVARFIRKAGKPKVDLSA